MIIVFMLVAAVMVAIIGSWLMTKGVSEEVEPLVYSVIALALLGFVSSIILFASSIDWMACGYRAEMLNKEFGTSYTRDQLFWAGDVVQEVQKLKHQRLELNIQDTSGKERKDHGMDR